MLMRMASILLAICVSTACGTSPEPTTPSQDASSNTDTPPSDSNSESGNAGGADNPAGETDTSGGSTTPDTGDATDGTEDSTNNSESDNSDTNESLDLSTLELNGTLPPEQLEAPTFIATNRDGEPRSQQDLIGQPTVMWFFPMAYTQG